MPRIAMLDWETLDTEPTAKVIAVGCVVSDLGAPGNETRFYTRIGTATQQDRTESKSTLAWWEKQTDAAKEHSFAGHDNPELPTLEQVITDLNNFITIQRTEFIMGNGNMFDCNIYRNINDQLDKIYPVGFWQDIDLRTAKLMLKGTKLAWPNHLTPHHARDDAEYQMISLQQWWRDIHG